MSRVVVIGDVGGHPDQLRSARGGPRVPDDVVVVPVVDRGRVLPAATVHAPVGS